MSTVTPEVTPPAVVAPVAPVEPVQAVSPAPAVVAPVVETPAVAPVVAPVVETPPAVAAPEAPAPETVLGDALKAEPVKEEPKVEAAPEAPKTEEPIKEEGQSDEPAPPPTYEPFTMPEDMTLAEDRLKEFTSILSEFELNTKADHAAVQQFGQKAVDFHIAEVKKTAEAIVENMGQEWENTKKTWKESFMNDPELGGNHWQTTVNAAINFIRTHGGNSDQQAEFRDLMESSGIGNHPAMIRLLANAGTKMVEGRPLVAQTPLSPPKSKTQTMYGRS